MKSYIGLKELKAQPMTLGEYNALRGWDMPAGEDPDKLGYLVEYENGGTPNHDNFDGYISWSPKAVFETAYKEKTKKNATLVFTVKRLFDRF